MKKAMSLLLIMLMIVSMIGCANQSGESKKEEPTPDEVFVEEFSKAINKRWKEQDKLAESLTTEEYNKKNAEILEEELETIEKSLANVEDKELKELGTQYVEGAKLQIEMFKSTDFELQEKYSEESQELRKPALVKLVDEYDVKIDEDNQQMYKDFKEQAKVINKENEANKYAEQLAQQITFEKSVDEYGDVTYTAIVENTSDIEFDSIFYDVQFKDAEGIVVGNDIVLLENFAPGTKQKVELTLAPEETETLAITLDNLTLK